MAAIQDTAELAVRNLFRKIASSRDSRTISAIDYMDDGTPIALKIDIDSEDGSATFDFTGTGPEVLGRRYTLPTPVFRILTDQDGRELERPDCHNDLCHHLCTQMHRRLGHSVEPRLHQARQDRRPRGLVPETLTRRRRLRRQRAHLPAHR